jgi:hypothetical protein
MDKTKLCSLVARTVVALAALTPLYVIGDDTLMLVPPAGSTKESRKGDLDKCIAIANEISRLTHVVTPFERIPLRGEPTGGFLSNGRPGVLNDELIPTRGASALGVNWGQSDVSDRYVICLLAKGYKWPDSVHAAADSPSSELRPEQETASLYEAGRMYRYRGLPQEGERLLRRAVELDEKRLPDYHPIMVLDIGELAIALLDLKRTDEGFRYVDRLLQVADRSRPQEKKFLAWIFENYAQNVSQEAKADYKSKLLATAQQLRGK